MPNNRPQPQNLGAIILAGGKSRRFGSNKALYRLNDIPLIQYMTDIVTQITSNIIIITNSPELYNFLPYPKHSDLIPATGPLGGIYTGLYYAKAHYNLVLPCDMPFINFQCIEYLYQQSIGYDIAVPVHDNLFEPLCAIYAKSCLPNMQIQLTAKKYQICQLYERLKTHRIPFSSALPFYHSKIFTNINSPQDLELVKT